MTTSKIIEAQQLEQGNSFSRFFSKHPPIVQILFNMSSSKRKWDDAPAEGGPIKAAKTDDTKTASEAAAAAAAIAAKIAAQFAGGALGGGGGDMHDADFTHDIDINDLRNRYMLTKGSTQTEVGVLFSWFCESGRSAD